MLKFAEPFVQYSVDVGEVYLPLGNGLSCPIPEVLSNGRASYVIFETLIRFLTGLEKTTGSDHVGPSGETYEQKAYADPDNRGISSSARQKDLFQTSASSTFGANNNGPVIKRFLENGDYGGALDICRSTGFDKNDFYIYTNTRGFVPSIPFKYIVIPTNFVLGNLSPTDPRMISRQAMLALVRSKIDVRFD